MSLTKSIFDLVGLPLKIRQKHQPRRNPKDPPTGPSIKAATTGATGAVNHPPRLKTAPPL